MSLLLSLMLTAAPAGPTTLIIEVQPEDTVVYVDGKKKGTGAKAVTIKNIPAGRHIIKVQRKGEGHEEEIVIKNGEKKTWKWAFEGSPPPKPKEPKETEKATETKVEEKKDEDLSLEKL
jgi:PEGA domain